MVNATEDIIMPESPNIHSQQTAVFYVQNAGEYTENAAGNDKKGVASFLQGQFIVENGKVRLRTEYLTDILNPMVQSTSENAELSSMNASDCKEYADRARVYSNASKDYATHGHGYAEQARKAAEDAVGIVNDAVTPIKKDIIYNSKRIENLEARLSDDVYISDSSVAYQKSVPVGVAPYAAIEKIGGMTYKSINLISPQKMLEASIETTLDGDVFTSNFTNGSLYLNQRKTIKFPAGNYSITIQPVSDKFSAVVYIYAADDGSTISSFYSMENTPSAPFYKTFSVTKEFVMCVGGLYDDSGKYYGTYSYKVQLAHGLKENAYSPHFEGLRHTKVKALRSEGANSFDISKANTINCTINNGVVKQIRADTASYNIFKLQKLLNGVYVGELDAKEVRTTGTVIFSFVKDSSFDGIAFGLNGSTIDTIVNGTIPNMINGTTYYLAFDVTNLVQGSVSWENIIVSKDNVPYTPYVGTIDTFAIPEVVQGRDGYGEGVNAEYRNYIEHTGGKWLDHKKSSKTIFDGSDDERWYVSDGYFKTSLADLSTNTETSYGFAVCDKYDETKLVDLPNKSFYCHTSYYGYGVISIRDDTVTLDVNAWRAHLQSNPLTFVYSLATPEIEDITYLMPIDNYIKVEGGGTIIADNKYEYAVPTTITYQKRG